MLDFDEIDDWESELTVALKDHVPRSIRTRFASAAPTYVEDARDLLFASTDREAVVDATLDWLRASVVVGYHGTRLTDDEVVSVNATGLVPLRAGARHERLARAMSSHHRWQEVSGKLDAAIEAYGPRGKAGRRENQVHLTLSRAGLTMGFNHYLNFGSEFDQQVAQSLLGVGAEQCLARDGVRRLIRIAVPGSAALNASHPIFSIENVRANGDVPNLAADFLKAWSYRLAYPEFQSRTLKIDCGMVFRSAVPPAWIMEIETLAD
jgi:hypothetical protein